jgi:hypothetical protein
VADLESLDCPELADPHSLLSPPDDSLNRPIPIESGRLIVAYLYSLCNLCSNNYIESKKDP